MDRPLLNGLGLVLLPALLALGCSPSPSSPGADASVQPEPDTNPLTYVKLAPLPPLEPNLCHGREELASSFAALKAAAAGPIPDSWGPDPPASLPRSRVSLGCADALEWRRNRLLHVVDALVREGFNYCNHHNPYWRPQQSDKCNEEGEGTAGVDCSNFTSLAYSIAEGGPRFTSHIEHQAGTGLRAELAPGQQIIAPSEDLVSQLARLQPGDLLFLENAAGTEVVHVQLWTGRRVGVDFERDRLTASHRARAETGDYVIVDSTGDGADSGPRYRLFNKSPKMVDQPDGPSWWRYHSARRVLLNPDFVWPIDSMVLSNRYYPTDDKGQPTHTGTVDLQATHMTPVFAARAGRVSKIHDFVGKSKGGYSVELVHRDDAGVERYATYYAHLFARPPLQVGELVQTGQRLGYVGRTGNSRTCHLHFSIRRRASPSAAWETLHASDNERVHERHWSLPRFSSIRQGDLIDLDGLRFSDLPDLSPSPHRALHEDRYRVRYAMRIQREGAVVYQGPALGAVAAHPPLSRDAVVTVTGFDNGFYRLAGIGYVLRDDVTDPDRRSQQRRIAPRPGETSVPLRCRPNNQSGACDKDNVYVRLLAGTLVNAYQPCPPMGETPDSSGKVCVLWRKPGHLIVSYYHVDADQLEPTSRITVLPIAPRLVLYDEPGGQVLATQEFDGFDAATTSPYGRFGILTVTERRDDHYKVSVDLDGDGTREPAWIGGNTTTGIR